MALVSYIKDNYLMKKIKAKKGEISGNDFIVYGDWLSEFRWTQATDNKPLGALLYIMCSMIDATATIVQGKLDNSGDFYMVDSISGSTITYKGTKETPSAAKIYIDVNDGNKVYRYDSGESAYVLVALS